jgi:hypothetical protein
VVVVLPKGYDVAVGRVLAGWPVVVVRFARLVVVVRLDLVVVVVLDRAVVLGDAAVVVVVHPGLAA